MENLPDFLIAMSRQMNEQDNRCTAEPIWQVRCKRHLVTEADYNEHHWEIIDSNDGVTLYHSEICDKEALAEWLIENEKDWCSEWMDEQYEMEMCADDDEFLEVFFNVFDVEDEYSNLPDVLVRLHFQETEEVVKTCLTEADARAFIARKQHDYPKLYTYVDSMTYCPQMIELRRWILSLTNDKAD